MRYKLMSFICFLTVSLPALSSGIIVMRSSTWSFEKQDSGKGFSIRFTYRATNIGTTLLEIPGTLNLSLIDGDRKGDDFGQNYVAAKLPDGSVPVLEATLSLRLPTKGIPTEQMRVGVPLAGMKKSVY